jgi:tripartite-type tricarboxylate transporter receptor subunit TctC
MTHSHHKPATPTAGLRAALGIATLAASLLVMSAVQAQEYPTKPIKVIVPFAAGGGTDVLARIWGDAMGPRLRQRIVVENQAGGNGAPGTLAGIKANPDGYTLVMGVASTMAINPHVMKNIGYQSTDLQPIAMIGFSPWLMAASTKLPFKTVPEMLAYGKANPGKLTMAAWTSTGEIGRKVLVLRTGVDILPVPYAGSAAAMTDLVAGRAGLALLDISAALPFLQSGDVRALAMTSSQRTALLPDVPSISEGGVKDYEVTSFVALFAPLRTPKDIVEKLNKETIAALNSPEISKKFADLGAEILNWDTAKVAEFLAAENRRWSAMVKETGSEPK